MTCRGRNRRQPVLAFCTIHKKTSPSLRKPIEDKHRQINATLTIVSLDTKPNTFSYAQYSEFFSLFHCVLCMIKKKKNSQRLHCTVIVTPQGMTSSAHFSTDISFVFHESQGMLRPTNDVYAPTDTSFLGSPLVGLCSSAIAKHNTATSEPFPVNGRHIHELLVGTDSIWFCQRWPTFILAAAWRFLAGERQAATTRRLIDECASALLVLARVCCAHVQPEELLVLRLVMRGLTNNTHTHMCTHTHTEKIIAITTLKENCTPKS